ncbi:MFS transporter [Myxococcus sp. CA051A]|uniref:MFS transporter n=1 Tax=unclassified Myxococcus TaxID=2648731 RepID=UPI00157A7B12|nr:MULTISPECIES: MFS transporter [unclassified Myxococcus]NTX14463.1 MFS transporter [Myxococcus sp. CA056]NTX41130.1 MFS transporter [Myxococcus sp. CA033]NTX53507.1 MFS transporter [Myxococcus sp. CA039A]NTX64212.1 MFS transporter [Myxococcus sp. CA051A]
MTSTTTPRAQAAPAPGLRHADGTAEREERLPIAGLLALAMAAFITVLTEALPAGLLPRMSADLGVSEALVGQLVTLYAIGTLVTAIPLTAATQGWRRRPLLILALLGFVVVNTVTAVSTNFVLTLGARFFAGVFAGLLWALVAGYAARMVPEHQQGRAMAIAMVGIPLALSLGIPAGTFLGAAVGWRVTFGIMSILTVILVGWVFVRLPDFPGQTGDRRMSIRKVFMLPGIRSVLFVTLAFVLSHNVLYTYIAPFLAPAGMAKNIDIVLLVFGVFALVSIWVIGVLIDRWLRELVLVSTALLVLVSFALGLWGSVPAVVYAGVAVWGLAYGGAATLFQTASAKAAGEAADVAQSMIVTAWNIAIAGGGIAGGVLLETLGVVSFPWMLVILLVPTLLVAWGAKRHGFPPAAGRR